VSTLLTGASGYVGGRLVGALDDDVIPLMRTPGGAGDLCEPDALDGIDTGRITRIIHAAAVTRFNVDRKTARRVNVEGTIRVAEFAERCPRLDSFIYLSTLYAAGRRTGDIPEEPLTGHGFVNDYEWSKHAAETALLERDLPLRVVRLPTLIADDDAGDSVGQHNAFHSTLRLYYYGLLSLLPGDPDTPLALASARYAVRALLEATDTVTHACPAPADTITLGELIDIAFTVFEQDDSFRRRMLLRPLPCDLASFRDLTSAAAGMRAGPVSQALGSVAPFAEQLYLPKVFQARHAHPVDTRRLVENVCATLVERRFGRSPDSGTGRSTGRDTGRNTGRSSSLDAGLSTEGVKHG
jgi:nucleoside-diphosphate-sugar epimerase